MSYDIEAFIAEIRPTIEADIDQKINAEPDPEARALLRRYRSMLIGKMLDATRIVSLKQRLVEVEARLRPRLVGEP